jgi:2,3-bisphosphoglycerate-independent phosphoglycerate mutase
MLMKLAFLIADGMGDRPLEELGGRTPLQAAPTPNMDRLAAGGLVGTVSTIPDGQPPGSDIANMALLGYDPDVFHTGRGPIEAAAQGLELAEDDLVWRCNLVTVSEFTPDGVMLDYAGGHPDPAQATRLMLALQEKLGGGGLDFVPGVSYRHLLLQKGGGQTPEAHLPVRPPHDILERPIAPDLEAFDAADHLWRLVRRAHAFLSGNPDNPTRANAVWPWGQGAPLALPSFAERFGLRGGVVTAVDLVRGLGRAAGLEVLHVGGATGLLDTDYAGKVQAALDFLEHGDFVFLHVEAPDECGHAGNAADKVEAIRRFDELVVGPMTEALGESCAFLVGCDHLTPIELRTHTSDPVPFLLAYPGLETRSGVESFSEKTASLTGLDPGPGHGLMSWVLERIG